MTYLNDRKIYGVVLLAAIVSCFAAFINNYPLVYQDTGSYIHSGFEGVVFDDRPIFYGLFIKWFSFSSTLWPVILAQGLLICYMVYLTLGMFFEGMKRNYIFIASITCLTLCTGLSFNVSILIPDIFSPIAVLCVINLLLNKKINLLQTLFIQLLFMFSVCTQFSSIAIIMLLFIFFTLYVIIWKLRKKATGISIKKLGITLGLFLSCLLIIPAVHYSYNKQFKISGVNHVFVMNHLVETGILEDYLSTACNDHSYRICEYKNNIGWDFVWSPESPLQKTGGWEANRKEYKAIIKDIVFTRKYFLLLTEKAIEYSLKQFFTFNVSISSPQLSSSAPFQQIEWRFKNSSREYISSLQNQSKLNIDTQNVLQQLFVLISMVFLCVVLITPSLFGKLSFELKATLVIFMAHNIINCIVCSNLATVHPRFQNRLAWLFPLLSFVIIMKLIESRKEIPAKNEMDQSASKEFEL